MVLQMTAESHATVAAFAIPLMSMDITPGLQKPAKIRHVKNNQTNI